MQHRALGWSDLCDLDAERPSVHDQNPPMAQAIPTVDDVARSPPQCPDREIKAKRRHWLNLEG
jgi:hypothetical protein